MFDSFVAPAALPRQLMPAPYLLVSYEMIRSSFAFLTMALALLLTTTSSASPLEWVEVRDLRPTQFTVGMKYVAEKQEQISKFSTSERHDYLRLHPIPAIRGYDNQLYMIDHHHLVRAVKAAGFHHVFVSMLYDWSDLNLTRDEFWRRMQQHGFVYLHDGHDRLRSVNSLPETIDDLQDDPYRALAGEVRDLGGFRKTTVPFTEFQWADYFRTRIPAARLKSHWKKSIELGMTLAKSPDARDLPGFRSHETCEGVF